MVGKGWGKGGAGGDGGGGAREGGWGRPAAISPVEPVSVFTSHSVTGWVGGGEGGGSAVRKVYRTAHHHLNFS